MDADVRSFTLSELKSIAGIEIAEDIADGTALGYGGLELESLHLLSLAVRAEERFGVKFGDDIVTMPSYTLGQFVTAVVSRAAGNP